MYDVLSVIGMHRGLRRLRGWSRVSGEDVWGKITGTFIFNDDILLS